MSHVVASIHTRTRIFVFAALFGAALSLGALFNGNVAGAAPAAFTCAITTLSNPDSVATITITAAGDLELEKDTGTGKLRINNAFNTCGTGGDILVNDLTKIVVNGSSGDDTVIDDVVGAGGSMLDGSATTPEADVDELEVEYDGNGGTDTWRFDNGAGALTMGLGDSSIGGFTVGVDKESNAGADNEAGEVLDEDISAVEVERFAVNGNAGAFADDVRGTGFPGNLGSVPSGFSLLLDGKAGADILAGGDGDDTLTGGAADDALTGGLGDDSYKFTEPGAGGETDTVTETATLGNDDVLDFTGIGSGSPATVDLGATSPTASIAGGRTIDQVGTNVDDVIGTAGADSITDNEGAGNDLEGADGSDTYKYNANPTGGQNDSVTEGATGDTDHMDFSGSTAIVTLDFTTEPGAGAQGTRALLITGSDEIESATGGSGNDSLEGHNPGMTLNGGPGNDLLIGGSAPDQLNGNAGDDHLKGNGDPDALDGGDDTDILEGGAGADSFDGGEGGTEGVNVVHPLSGTTTIGDAADYRNSPASVTVNLETGAASGGDAAGDTYTLGSVESLYGANLVATPGDSLTGDSQDNRLEGFAGDDTLTGRNGNDTKVGGTGDDTYNEETASNGGDNMIEAAGAGTDTVNYCARTNPVSVSKDGVANDGEAGENDNVDPDIENVCAPTAGINLTGTPGNDVLVGSPGNDNIDGLGGDDDIFGRNGDDNLDGGDGNDYLYGEGGTDTLDGGEDDDELEGGGDDDHMDGGADAGGDDIDELTYKNSPGLVNVDLGNGTATQGDATGDTFTGIENLTGSQVDASGDVLVGDANDNTLDGMGGDDLLNGKEGDDTLIGGDDDDTYEFDMDFQGGGETDEVDEQSGGGDDTLDHTKTTERVDGNLAAALTMSSMPDTAESRSVNVAGGSSSSHFENLLGGSGPDNLTGNATDNRIEGNGDTDVLDGNENDDTLDGGADTDTLTYNGEADAIEADLVAGTVNQGTSVDVVSDAENVIGTTGNDILRGGPSVNTLVGGNGDDILEGRGSGDTLIPGDDNDTASYESSPTAVQVVLNFPGSAAGGHAAGDVLCGDSDTNTICTVVAPSAFENVTGSTHDDDLTGDSGANVLKGLAGNDGIDGNNGADNLQGGDDDDELIGDGGADSLNGGADTDRANYDTDDSPAPPDSVTVNLTTGLGARGNAAGDTLADIEHVDGTDRDDRAGDILTGNSGPNTLRGFDGDDTLEGRGGADNLDGGTDADTASYKNSSAIVHVDLSADSANGGDAEGDELDGIENLVGADVLGSGDTLVGDNNANVIDGGIGDDRLVGLNDDDTLNGGLDDDILEGGNGTDTLNGNEDDDIFKEDTAANGDDAFNGGSGEDEVSYDERTGNVNIDMDGLAFDGEAGEGDNVATDVENAFGGEGDDTISGANGVVNELHGGPGDDFVTGRSEDDHVFGEDGNDSVQGEEDDDVVDGGNGNDTLLALFTGDGADVFIGGDNEDVISYFGRAAAVTVNLNGNADDGEAGEGDNVYADVENILGGAGGDLLIGSSAANDIDGNGGDDEIQGLGGADDLDGGAHAGLGDTLSYSGSPGIVFVDLQAGTASGPGSDADGDTIAGFENAIGANQNSPGDTLRGTTGSNRLYGLGGDDALVGRASDDNLFGGEGDDRLDGGVDDPGVPCEILDGGPGNDVADYFDSPGGENIDLETAAPCSPSGPESDGDDLQNIEGLNGSNVGGDTLRGNAGDGVFNGNGGNDILQGRGGNDVLNGGANDTPDPGTGTLGDWIEYTGDPAIVADLTAGTVVGGSTDTVENVEHVLGSSGNDVIKGNSGINFLDGAAGDDEIEGMNGADRLIGGADEDTLVYTSSNLGVDVDIQNNTATGGHADGDVIPNNDFENAKGSDFNDTLRGNASANELFGAGGDDHLEGRAGADNLEGGETGESAGDHADYSADTTGVNVDLATGAASGGDAAGDTLGGIENLTGGTEDDVLKGNADDNELVGNAGGDSLVGRAGDDSLEGGDGDDSLEGGAGADSNDGGADTDAVSYANSPGLVQVNLSTGNAAGGDADGDTLTSIENVIGSNVLGSGDILIGDGSDNVLDGMGGDDRLNGKGGDDDLIGGEDDDTFEFDSGAGGEFDQVSELVSEGSDTLDFSDLVPGDALTADLTVSDPTDAFGAPTDLAAHTGRTVEVLAAAENLNLENVIGGQGPDTILGNDNENTLEGGDGIDHIEGGLGHDTILGGPGNEVTTLIGGPGDDEIDGGLGNDVFDEGPSPNGDGADVLTGGDGEDTITYFGRLAGVTVNPNGNSDDGEPGEGDNIGPDFENIIGTDEDDLLIGNSLNNDIEGRDGDDRIAGLGGADDLDGEGDEDTLDYSASAGLVTVDLGTSTASGAGSDADGDTIANFENVIGAVQNSPGDTLVGDGGDNTLTGLGGDDTLRGEAGNDQLFGNDGDDVLDTGDNTLFDTADGGNGSDTADYSTSPAAVDVDLMTNPQSGGYASGDTLTSVENVDGSSDDDFLRGNQADNRLRGNDGDDFLKGRGGDDDLQGGLGTDTIDYVDDAFIDESAIEADLGAGTVDGGSIDTTSGVENINGTDEGDILTGNQKINVINAGDGDDTLAGLAQGDALDCDGGANDVLDYSASPQAVNVTLPDGPVSGGHAEGDTINDCEGVIGSSMGDTIGGTPDPDTMTGGPGNDTFLCSLGADTIDADGGVDLFDCSADTVGFGLNLITGDGTGPSPLVDGDSLTNFENVLGGSGGDNIIGNQQDNELYGNEGDDTLEGRGGADYLDGGEGGEDTGDTSDYSNSPEQVQVNMGTGDSAGGDADGDFILNFENIVGSNWLGSGDLIVGDGGPNILAGLGGDDEIYGLGGNDTLTGGFGDDLLDGGADDDHAAGNQGNDSYVFGPATAATEDDEVEELLGEGSDTLDLSTLPGDEPANVDLTDDTDIANHSDGVNNRQVVVDTGAGGAADNFENAKTGAAADEILGNDAPNVLEGNDSTDHIEGGLGSDTLLGGPGAENATLIGGPGDDVLDGGLGNDVFDEGPTPNGDGADVLKGGDGIDRITYLGRVGTGVNVNPNGNSDDGQAGEGDNVHPDVENIDGTDLADTLIGTSGINVINGFDGNDQIAGLGPTSGPGDTLAGGAGSADTVDYSASLQIVQVDLAIVAPTAQTSSGDANGDVLSGFENVYGAHASASGDTLKGDALINEIRGLGGDDNVTGREASDTLTGGLGNDNYVFEPAGGVQTDTVNEAANEGSGDHYDLSAITVDVDVDLTSNGTTVFDGTRTVATNFAANIEDVTGGAGDDSILGNAADNVLVGGAGDDLLEGKQGNDTLEGGTNGVDGDTISFATGVAVNANLNTGVVTGGSTDQVSEVENVIGSNQADVITGDGHRNILVGLGGDDIFQGLGEADTFHPGTEADTLDYSASPEAVTIDLNTTPATFSGGHAAGDIACANDPTWTDDPLTSLVCTTQNGSTTENLVGSALNDTLQGNVLANIIRGGNGDDTIIGLGPVAAPGDTLDGDGGNDTTSYAGSPAGVTINLTTTAASGGDAAGDTLLELENVTGSSFNDILVGNTAINRLLGADGDDTLEGRGGADVLNGGANTVAGDWADYSNSPQIVQVNLTSGNAAGGDGDGDSLTAVENVRGSNWVGSGDYLVGDGGANVLEGLNGDDRLVGQGGNDTLRGGRDNDTYEFADTTPPETDTIREDSGEGEHDALDFGPSLFDSVSVNLSSDLDGGTGGFQIALHGAGPDRRVNDELGGAASFIEDVWGSKLNDTIVGNVNNNILHGNDGVDTINGLAGADQIFGDAGDENATLTGGAGTDVLNGGLGNDVFAEGSATDGAGADVFYGDEGIDGITYLGRGSGVVVNLDNLANDGEALEGDNVRSDVENITGTAHNDTLVGSSAQNTIDGNAGDDIIAGLGPTFGAGDTLIGGAHGVGGDTIDYSASPGIVTVDLLAGTAGGPGSDANGDSISGFENVDGSIVDASGDDLRGDSGVNRIRGLGGDDRITGRFGNDDLHGGPDDDIYAFATMVGAPGPLETDTVTENIGSGNDTLDFAALPSIEPVTVDLTLDVPSDIATHTGGGNVRHVITNAAGTAQHFENATGGSGDDTLRGNSGQNRLLGGPGNDLLQGRAQDDVLDGGEGASDTITYDGETAINANLTTKVVIGASEDDVNDVENVIGTGQNDVIVGDHKTNILVGAGGNDVIEGMAQGDSLKPGAGTDTLSYESSDGAVSVNLDTGAVGGLPAGTGHADGDTLCGGAAASLTCDAWDDSFENAIGSAFNDSLVGNVSVNRLTGGEGDDSLEGKEGGDFFIGGGNNTNGPNSGDTASYVNSPSGVTVNLNSGDASGGHATDDNLSDIENTDGSAFADTLRGNEDRNRLRGQGGDDLLEGRGGPDVLDGGAHNGAGDTADYKNSETVVQVNLLENVGNMGDAQGDSYAAIENVQGSNVTGSGDIIIGDDNANVLTGLGGDDSLFGMGAGDNLVGGFGLDLLDGGEGGDSATGNQDSDTYRFVTALAAQADTATETSGGGTTDHLDFSELLSDDPVTLSMASGAAQGVHTNRTLTLVGPSFFENASGGEGADDIDGNAAKNEIWGNGSPDALAGLGGDDILHGGTGNDTEIDGGAGDDSHYGDSGNDVFSSPAIDDSDVYSGGTGRDQISYFGRPSGVMVILNGLADDGEVAEDENDHVLADVENIRGTNSNDTLIGSNTELGTSTVAANTILGEGGDDRIAGLAGADTLVGGANGAGGDTLDYQDSPSAVNVTLPDGPAAGGHAELDTISGFENLWGSNVLGGSTADILIGDGGPNQLKGFNGNDVLVGNDGDDDLIGGNHNDIYGFGSTVDPQTDDVTELTDGGTDTLSWDDSVSGPVAAGVTVDLAVDSPTATQGGGPRTVDANDADNLENVVGGDGDDTIYGNKAENVISGSDGDDEIAGRAGDDDLDGDDHNGDGDTITYQPSPQSEGVLVNLGPLPTSFGTGIGVTTQSVDTLHGFENIDGSDFDDELRGTAGDNVINGFDGSDVIAGRGDTGDTDELDGGGGTGTDTVDYSEVPAAGDGSGVDVDLAAGTATETWGFDALEDFENVWGSNFNDRITGDGDENSLSGNDGDDVIAPLGDDDDVNGGDHETTGDEIDLSATAGGGVNVDFRKTDGEVTPIGGDSGTDNVDEIENVRATNFADVVYGSDVANRIWGLDGNDGINPMRGDDFVFAGNGNDDLFAMADYDGKDDWHGDGGAEDRMTFKDRKGNLNVSLDDEWNDGFVNSEGDNVRESVENLDGGQGHDKLSGSDVRNVILGESGNDQIYGRRGNDILRGMVGADGIRGEHGNDSLFGEDGNDGLVGGVGLDREFGGRNNDIFYQERVSNGRDDISGGLGVDQVDYRLRVRRVVVFIDGLFNDGEDANGNNLAEEKDRVRSDVEKVVGGRSNDRLVGDGRRNFLYGMQGHDVLSGGGGHDLLYGHTGHDNLVGGTGRDLMEGQSGNDNLFACDNDRDKVRGGSGTDDAERDLGKDSLSSIDGSIVNC